MNYKKIIASIISSIYSGDYKVDNKLPSENAIMIKYSVSRIVATRVFMELGKIGAIYTIPKKGHFVAKHFYGLVKPISFMAPSDRYIDSKQILKIPKYFHSEKILGDWKTFVRTYYNNSEEVIWSQNFSAINIDEFHSEEMVDILKRNYGAKSSIMISRFEMFNADDNYMSVVNYRIIYSESGILMVNRFKIKDKYFEIKKQEFIF